MSQCFIFHLFRWIFPPIFWAIRENPPIFEPLGGIFENRWIFSPSAGGAPEKIQTQVALWTLPKCKKSKQKSQKQLQECKIFALRALSTPICITFHSKPLDLKRKIAAKRRIFLRGKNRREAAKFFPPILKSKNRTLIRKSVNLVVMCNVWDFGLHIVVRSKVPPRLNYFPLETF